MKELEIGGVIKQPAPKSLRTKCPCGTSIESRLEYLENTVQKLLEALLDTPKGEQ